MDPGHRREVVLEVDDHATKKKARIDFEFVEELERLEADFPEVRVPVLVLHGTKDDVVDIDSSRTWARGRPHIRVVELDDGHELTSSIPRILEEAGAFLAPFLGTGSD